jgi:GR25 family glycosyltransferase involved in LPS biosynthesis
MNSWDFLEQYDIQVWCICLKERNDRFVRVQKEFKDINLIKYVNFHRPPRHENGVIGCMLSHKHCAEMALACGKHALVFEDDVTFTPDWLEKIEHIKDFLKSELRWNILRLGTIISSLISESKSTSKIWLCKSYSSHAVIYNINVIKFIFPDNLFLDQHIDDYLHDDENILDYSLVNYMCYQKSGLGSDINWFGLNFIQSVMESKYIFEPLQKYNNIHAWYIRWLPCCIQDKVTMWALLTNLGFLSNKICSIVSPIISKLKVN